MAKQVSNIFINLGIKNAEGLDKLKSAFRELDKAVGPTSKSIDSAIAAVKRFSDSNERSEQLIRGQIEAFKGLRSQVDVGGNRYSALTNEIGRLQAELRGSTDALERQREKLLRTASAGNQNAKSLQNQIASLERLRQQTRPGSSAFIQLGKDIDAATVSLGKFKSVASQAAQIASQGIGASFFKAGRQVQALQADLQTLNFSSAEFLNRQKEINRILNQQASSVGRQNVRANAAVYTDPGYSEYMERRGRNLPLPATPAGYQQRIGEINAELENISTLERRRELTLELDKLNRQLKGTIIDATSAEQRAVDVVRARVNAQREVLSQSGFRAFSASISGRNFKAEEQQQTIAKVTAAFAAIETAYENMSAAVQGIAQRTLQQELDAIRVLDEENRQAHEAYMQRQQQEIEASDRWYKQEEQRIDLLLQQRKAAASALGLGGRDLSPLYERITGLATAGVSQQQQFMGRNATQVYNDIATAFNKGGRPVDIKEKSTYIGDSIAQGVSEGANTSSSITSGAKGFADKLIGAYKTAFGIKSPSRESKQKIGVPIGQGIGEGIIEGVNSLKTQIQLAIQGAIATPRKAPLYRAATGPLSSTAERLQAFVVQSAANAPKARGLTRLIGEEITSSRAIPLAMYRRAYERGELMPDIIGSLSDRRLGRRYAIPGTPGYGLEQVLEAEAFKAVGRTGAFVGPLSGGLTRAGAFGALSAPRVTGGLSPIGAASLPLFASSQSLAPLQRSLPGMAYGMGGSAFPLAGPLERIPRSTRSAASASVRESIGTYRKAVDNFWEGETNTFTTIRRIISGNVQVSASRLARSLTETRSSLSTLATETTKATGLPAEVFGRLRAEVRAARQQIAVQQGASGLQKLGVFPVAGMMGPSSPLIRSGSVFTPSSALLNAGGGGSTPPSTPPNAGGGGGGSTPPSTPLNAGGGGFTQLNTELTKFGALNRRSINDLQDLKGILSEVHTGLSPIANDYDKVNRAIERQNTLIDKELAKRQRGGGRRLGGQQLAQIAGASISGGIFGGPEGLIGGIAGGIVGGVGGSFAGAAFGAQAGMLRQQIGAAADYAAQLQKLRISLKGITQSNKEYQQALEATAYASSRFNLLPAEATQSFTRLLASIKGAGGTVKDTQVAFNAITSAIKATGGGAEQVDGAMVALSQVFSKGKVSAEELNQIAERLPGTFTLFAKSAGMTGPELQKALENGTVSLNDFMKFVVAAGDKYSPIMDKLAGSTENAGERMKVSLSNLRVAVGNAFIPIGAAIQNTISRLADMALAAARALRLVQAASGAERSISRGKDIQEQVGAAYRAVQSQGAQGILPGFKDPRAVAYQSITTALSRITPQANLEGTRQNVSALKDLIEVQRRLTIGSGVSQDTASRRMALLTKQSRILQGRLQEEEARFKRLNEAGLQSLTQFPTSKDTKTGGKTAEDRSAEQAAETERRLAQEGIKIQMDGELKAFEYAIELDRRRYELRKQLSDEATANEIEGLQGGARTVAQAFATYRAKLAEIDRNVVTAQQNVSIERERLRTSQAVSAVVSGRNYANVGGTNAGGRQMLHGIPGYAGYDASHATPSNIHYHFAGKDPAETLAVATYLKGLGYKISEFKPWTRVGTHAEGSQHYSANAFDIGGATMGRTMPEIQAGQQKLHRVINDFLATTVSAAVSAVAGKTATTGRDRSQLLRGQKAGGKVDVATQALGQAAAMLTEEQSTVPGRKLEAEKALTLELTKAYSAARYELQLTYELDLKRAELQSKGYASAEIDKELKLYELRRTSAEQIARIRKETEDPGEQEKQIAAINTGLQEQVNLLEKIYNLNQATANSIGFREGAQRYIESIGTMRDATTGLAQQGFKGIEDSIVSLATTGTANFAQFATSLLNDMARIIIQQLVVKQLAQAIGNLFGMPGGGGGGENAMSGIGGPINIGYGGGFMPSAMGNVFGANGIVPYAKGGVVTRPMLFPFANGGAIGTGLMGEAGPEAIMPLQRGPNGKLGVMAAGGGTTNIVVNVDASGNSQVQGRDDTANQLGKVVAAVVQQELVKQKRPGGLLA